MQTEKKKTIKKILWIIGIVALVLVIALGALYWHTHVGNRQQIDTSYFDRAILRLPNGEIVEGKLNSWLDFADSDVVQVKIDGTTYLTSYVNVCLIND